MHIVIIGNGIAGITAARTLRKLSDHRITVISDEGPFFFSRPALMYVYMGHMGKKELQPYEPFFWTKNRIELRQNRVENIVFEAKMLELDDSSTLHYDKLIIATGSKPNMPQIDGQSAEGVQGLYHYQDLESLAALTARGISRGIIIGGGLIGIELAEMLLSRGIPVSLLVREASFWAQALPPEESAMINRHIVEHGIDLQLNTTVKSINTDDEGRACGVETHNGHQVEGDFVGLTIGVSPNIDFLRHTALHCQRGICVNDKLETNLPDVYAIGDCAEQMAPQKGRRALEAIWYTGRMMGETVARLICGDNIRYQPGTWFNSAKFLDIEYQVYGQIEAVLPPEQDTLYWEAPDGKKSIRLNYERETGHIKGFNLMGIRYRHEVCERWIQSQTPIEAVLSDLSLANFDPEFFPMYESFLIDIYAKKSGKTIKHRPNRRIDAVWQFLKNKF